MINLTDNDFESEVLHSDQLVFVDCYAEWCGPCKALKPLLVDLEAENPEVKFGMLDIDGNPDSAARLKVTAIPTVVVFKDGEEVARFLGMRPKKDYQDVID